MANGRVVQQQHRDFQAVAGPEAGVRIDIQDADLRLPAGAETLELHQHLIAKVAALARQDGETDQGMGIYGARSVSAGGISAPGFIELAMNCTVCAGTSPTAVTWWPFTVIE